MPSKRKITQTKPLFGSRRSHSMRATRHVFKPNMQSKAIYVPELNRFVRVWVTARELRTIDKIGLVEFLRRHNLSLEALAE